jgi:hypothetical protein
MNGRTSFNALTLLILTLTLPPAARAGSETVTALSGFDPVALAQGTVIKGKEELQATRGRYRLVEVSGKGEVAPLPPEGYEFMRRRLYREPLALLRAGSQPEFAAVAAGTG